MCVFGFTACDDTCEPGSTQECYCPDGQVTRQTCNSDGFGWGACEDCTTYSVWCDDYTDLCWQDPQKDAYNPDNIGVVSYDAVRYCDELVLGGYDDWRLPTIMELRSIIAGSPLTEDGWFGAFCTVDEGSTVNYHSKNLEFTTLFNLAPGMMKMMPCMGTLITRGQFKGPDESGCYWKEELSGNCDRVDIKSPSHRLETWSSTLAADDPKWQGFVFFDYGAVGFNHEESLADVRCVRDAPTDEKVSNEMECMKGDTQMCLCDNGKMGSQTCVRPLLRESGWKACDCTGFEPSPEPEDVSDLCDQIKVTVNLNRELEQQPYLLAVFLYKAGEVFMRPPDVGVYENAIFYPDIDKGKPITTVIPGCSYYKDRCMSGNYYLVVYLKMNEGTFPGMPDLVDRVWMNFDTIELNGDGTSYYEFDVEAVPMLESPYYMIFKW